MTVQLSTPTLSPPNPQNFIIYLSEIAVLAFWWWLF